jgi:hypothetical protein
MWNCQEKQDFAQVPHDITRVRILLASMRTGSEEEREGFEKLGQFMRIQITTIHTPNQTYPTARLFA